MIFYLGIIVLLLHNNIIERELEIISLINILNLNKFNHKEILEFNLIFNLLFFN